MKEVFVDLASYHRWANMRLTEAVLRLPRDLPDKTVPSSFPTLTKTFAHVYWSERVWLKRLQLAETEAADIEFTGRFPKLAERLLAHNERFLRWVGEQKEVFFTGTIVYYNSERQYYKSRISQCILHILNHGTYHRGQIVTMLHALDSLKIPDTDYIAFKRAGG